MERIANINRKQFMNEVEYKRALDLKHAQTEEAKKRMRYETAGMQ